jgi:hypothetical protein
MNMILGGLLHANIPEIARTVWNGHPSPGSSMQGYFKTSFKAR